MLLLNHDLIKKKNLVNLDKLHCQELYDILVYTTPPKSISQVYFENLFHEREINCKEIYILPGKVSLDCNVRSFQYKVLNNDLYLNKKLFIFGKLLSSLYSFCKQADEILLHFFYKCNITKELWNGLDLFFNDCLHLPQLSPQTTFFGFFDTYSNNLIL